MNQLHRTLPVFTLLLGATFAAPLIGQPTSQDFPPAALCAAYGCRPPTTTGAFTSVPLGTPGLSLTRAADERGVTRAVGLQFPATTTGIQQFVASPCILFQDVMLAASGHLYRCADKVNFVLKARRDLTLHLTDKAFGDPPNLYLGRNLEHGTFVLYTRQDRP